MSRRNKRKRTQQYKPKVYCPYCNKQAALVDSRLMYQKSYGQVWLCFTCQAWVGCHKATLRPLGTLAKADLRIARRHAHRSFDMLWKAKKANGHDNARTLGYQWLADQMGLDMRKCHIGYFSIEQCEQVIAICQPYVDKINERRVNNKLTTVPQEKPLPQLLRSV